MHFPNILLRAICGYSFFWTKSPKFSATYFIDNYYAVELRQSKESMVNFALGIHESKEDIVRT